MKLGWFEAGLSQIFGRNSMLTVGIALVQGSLSAVS